VARIRIEGMITGNSNTLKMLSDIEKAKQVKALMVHIDSPGGTTAGSEAIYEHLRDIAKDRPVVAVMDTVAASGGYITAIGADHIVARGNTITGSIGVIFQWAQVKDLLGNLGITFRERKSGELKAEPNMFDEPSEKALAVTDAMIRDSFNWFTGLVKERRGLNPQQML
jgi:protease-4